MLSRSRRRFGRSNAQSFLAFDDFLQGVCGSRDSRLGRPGIDGQIESRAGRPVEYHMLLLDEQLRSLIDSELLVDIIVQIYKKSMFEHQIHYLNIKKPLG